MILHFWSYLLTRFQPAHSKRNSSQKKWLTEKFALFLDHQAKKSTGQFFPSLYEEFFAKWPPTPTEEEKAKADGKLTVATARARQAEETVRDFEFP